jgi:hypothetical protein
MSCEPESKKIKLENPQLKRVSTEILADFLFSDLSDRFIRDQMNGANCPSTSGSKCSAI